MDIKNIDKIIGKHKSFVSMETYDYFPVSVIMGNFEEKTKTDTQEKIIERLAEINIDKDAIIHQQEIIEQFKKEVEELMEEQDKHRWIPVSERLPENEVEVQICARSKNRYNGKYWYTITSAHHQDGTMHTEDSKWNWVDFDFEYCEETDDWIIYEGWWEERHYNPYDEYNNLIVDEVIAWIPLPEPYVEGKNE